MSCSAEAVHVASFETLPLHADLQDRPFRKNTGVMQGCSLSIGPA